MKSHIAAALTAAAVLAGCQGPRTEPSTVRGSATIQVDESLEPVMRLEVEDFGNSYPDAKIAMSVAHAREAVVNFLNDSVRVIVLGRELNNEERAFVNSRKGKKDEIDLAEWRVAMDAVAVIVHPGNPVTKFRFGELDSIFSGLAAFWPGGGRNPVRIGPVVPDVNSSVGSFPAQDTAIMDPPTWFTAIPATMTVDGRLPLAGYYLAGLWQPDAQSASAPGSAVMRMESTSPARRDWLCSP